MAELKTKGSNDFLKKLTIDKVNGDLAFNDQEHLYWNTKYPHRKYTSVTTLIGKYHEKFDEFFWSRYKALERIMTPELFSNTGVKSTLLTKKKWDPAYLDTFDIDPQTFEDTVTEIVAGYTKNRDEACERGTLYHNKKENNFYAKPDHTLKDYNFGLDLPQTFTCEKNNFDLNRENAVLPEYLIYYSSPSGILNMAGQIDVLIKQGNDIYILDYKTNAKGIETKAYFNPKTKKKKTMFAPITNIEDTTLEHYTLQLSTYAYMLQQINPDFEIKLLRICHIDGDGNETLIDLQYRKEDVKKLFKHYEKQLIIDHYRKTGQILKTEDLGNSE